MGGINSARLAAAFVAHRMRSRKSESGSVGNGLDGRRILVVEDSPLIAVLTEELLHELGCIVLGPTGNMAIALELAEQEQLDAAIIDINIRGAKAFPVAGALDARNIPFVLTSGYADWEVPEQWRDRPRLAKPYGENDIRNQLLSLLEPGTPTASTRA